MYLYITLALPKMEKLIQIAQQNYHNLKFIISLTTKYCNNLANSYKLKLSQNKPNFNVMPLVV